MPQSKVSAQPKSAQSVLAPGDRFLRPREAAELLSSSTNTLNYWRVQGVGPRYHKIGHSVRYLLSDVMAWAATRVVEVERLRA